MTSMYEYSQPHPLRVSQIRGVLVLFGILACAALVKLAWKPEIDPMVQQARAVYEQEKIRYAQARLQLKQAQLPRVNALKFYGVVSLFGSLNLAILIVAAGFARAKLRQASLCSARIGEHSTIPIRYQDLSELKPVILNLSLAELEAAISSSHDKAYQISRQMMQDVTTYTRAIAGPRSGTQTHADLGLGRPVLPLTDSVLATPTVAELLRTRTLAPGKPLVMGFSHNSPLEGGQGGVFPEYRDLADLKSVAVAGWQGSGKTRSMAYFIAAAVVTQDIQVFVVDPHKDHPESLASVIAPLTKTGRVSIINPFDTPQLIARLHQTLDRRLSGQESSEQGIVLVIDELARMAKMEYFDDLITLLERCTEETRKANITFLGGSPKWTARHFKGRADIRSCMNSMLIHKTKPSQADLLLEDAQEKKLVKELQHPGQAILVTDYAPPVVVTMPLCCRQDMEAIAEMIATTKHTKHTKKEERIEPQRREDAKKKEQKIEITDERIPLLGGVRGGLHGVPRKQNAKNTKYQTRNTKPATRRLPEDVIPLASQREKHQDVLKPEELTLERIIEQIQYRKQQEKGLTQASIARWSGMSPSLLSRILNGHTALTEEHKRRLFKVLFQPHQVEAVNQ